LKKRKAATIGPRKRKGDSADKDRQKRGGGGKVGNPLLYEGGKEGGGAQFEKRRWRSLPPGGSPPSPEETYPFLHKAVERGKGRSFLHRTREACLHRGGRLNSPLIKKENRGEKKGALLTSQESPPFFLMNFSQGHISLTGRPRHHLYSGGKRKPPLIEGSHNSATCPERTSFISTERERVVATPYNVEKAPSLIFNTGEGLLCGRHAPNENALDGEMQYLSSLHRERKGQERPISFNKRHESSLRLQRGIAASRS